MKQTLLIIVCLIFFANTHSQGITLLYKGGTLDGWDDPVNWIQINTPVGQTPIQRAPTELDDVVFSGSQSGLSSVNVGFANSSDSIKVGGSTTTGHRCRSMHVSNTDLSLSENDLFTTLTLNVYTTNGGFVLIDSGSNVRYGHFILHGGNSELTDMEIINSTFGSLFSHNNWSEIHLMPDGKARFVGSTLGGFFFGSDAAGGELYAENCTFMTVGFSLGDSSTGTLLNCPIENDGNNPSMTFHIGKNANFVSDNVNVSSAIVMDFYTSGSVLNGNVAAFMPQSSLNFTQEDPANPLPNIINGSVVVNEEATMGISGDVKISGNFENNSSPLVIYPDTAHLFINGQHIFEVGGIKNYGNNLSITDCVQNYCHFNLEFFGNTNSNIFWPMGLPVDTLVINKTGCAKVTFTNSLYVSGQAKIKSGQLVLNPNDTIPYKFVCAGDLNIYQGGGIFLRKDSNGVVANMAIAGAINDYNLTTDSTCVGLSNPYNGTVTLYREAQNGGNNLINISSASNIGNLNLIGQTGSDFMLGGNLTVNNFNFVNPGKLLLGDHHLAVNGSISNYGPDNYFVTNGLGYLQVNNIGNTATVFPVGTSTSSYTPATLTNFGTTDNFKVSVQPQVLSAGTTGNSYIAGVVNRTWNIYETTPGGSDITLQLQWNAEDELSGFTRNTSYVSHYISGAWNNGSTMAANGSDPYSLTRTNITSFSPFAVMSPAGVVPLTLLDFYGAYINKTVALNWSTESELNTKFFTVEKSVDAISFMPLTNIAAYNNQPGKENYHYVDNTFLNAMNYYRLKMVDVDGSYAYSKTISIAAPSGHVFVFPNPVKDKLFITIPNVSTETTIHIVDVKGIIVKTLQLKAGVTAVSFNTTELPVGVYSIIFDSGKVKETLQFIKD